MFFEVDWIEDETGFTKCVFQAKDFDTMYRAIKHMNIERQGMKRPTMKGIRIKALVKYDGEYSEITGNFDHDMAIDAESGQR